MVLYLLCKILNFESTVAQRLSGISCSNVQRYLMQCTFNIQYFILGDCLENDSLLLMTQDSHIFGRPGLNPWVFSSFPSRLSRAVRGFSLPNSAFACAAYEATRDVLGS